MKTTKMDLVKSVAFNTRLPEKSVKYVIDSFVANIKEEIQDGYKVVVSGLGTFLIRSRNARPGRNPKTGETIELPEMRTIGFVPSKRLRKEIQ